MVKDDWGLWRIVKVLMKTAPMNPILGFSVGLLGKLGVVLMFPKTRGHVEFVVSLVD